MNDMELNIEKPEITLNGLADLTEGSFLLIDTRDEASYEYGTMENAVHFPNLYEEARAGRMFEMEILEGHLMPDHVHLLLSIPPKYSVSQIMGYIKGKSSLEILAI